MPPRTAPRTPWMLDAAELERRWRAAPAPPRRDGTVRLLVLRTGQGGHATPDRIALSRDGAIAGDRFPTDPRRHADAQVSLIEWRTAMVVGADDPARLHLPGTNLVVDLDLGRANLPAGTQLAVGTAILELTDHPFVACHKFRARLGGDAARWCNAREHHERRLRGVYARIVRGGAIGRGDPIAPYSSPITQVPVSSAPSTGAGTPS